MKRLLSLVGLLILPLAARGEPAVRILVTSSPCAFGALCPDTPPPLPTTAVSGAEFGIYVAAVDAALGRDTEYSGTLTLSSSDPLATLPSSYTFVPADRGTRGFSVVLRTLGDQVISVSDSENKLIPGTLVMTVEAGQVPDSIPTLSLELRIALALILAAVGVRILLRS